MYVHNGVYSFVVSYPDPVFFLPMTFIVEIFLQSAKPKAKLLARPAEQYSMLLEGYYKNTQFKNTQFPLTHIGIVPGKL